MLNLTFHLHSPVPHHPNYHCFVSSYITERRADNNKHPLSWHLLIIRVTFIFFLLLFLSPEFTLMSLDDGWERSSQSVFKCFPFNPASLLQRFLNKASIRLEMMCAPCLWGKLHSDSFLFSHVTAKYDCWLPALCVSTWLHDYCLLQLCIFFILFNLVMHQVATFGAEKWSQALKTRVVTAVKHQWICKLLHWSSMYIVSTTFLRILRHGS